MIKQLILAATVGLATLPAHAVEIAVAPGEAYLRVTQGEKNILFVDVRDPVEIMFVGFADTVHVNVPFMLVDLVAPVVVAKGADMVAERIKKIARENNVPIRENKPLARALYKDVDIGEMIPENLY